MTAPLREFSVVADLELEVDGQAIRVSGDGPDVVISVPDLSGLAKAVAVVSSAVGGSLGARRRLLGTVANASNRGGIRVTVVGRSGPVVTIGRGVNVRVSRWLARSPHVRVHPGRESVTALVALLRR